MLLEGVESVEDAEEGLLPPVNESESVAPGRVLTTCSDTVIASLCHQCILSLSNSLSFLFFSPPFYYHISSLSSSILFCSTSIRFSHSRLRFVLFLCMLQPRDASSSVFLLFLCKYTHTHIHKCISTSHIFLCSLSLLFSFSIFASIVPYRILLFFHSLYSYSISLSFCLFYVLFFLISLSLFRHSNFHYSHSFYATFFVILLFCPCPTQITSTLCASTFFHTAQVCLQVSSLKTFPSLVARSLSQPMNTSFRLYTGCPALLSMLSFMKIACLFFVPFLVCSIIFYSFSKYIQRWML